MSSANSAMTALRNAASDPFQSDERHIWNHSPPMARKPPTNCTTIIVSPIVANARALVRLRTERANHEMVAAPSAKPASSSHAMIPMYAAS